LKTKQLKMERKFDRLTQAEAEENPKKQFKKQTIKPERVEADP